MLWVWLLLSLDHDGLYLDTLSGQVYSVPPHLWGPQWEQEAPPRANRVFHQPPGTQEFPSPVSQDQPSFWAGFSPALSCVDGVCSAISGLLSTNCPSVWLVSIVSGGLGHEHAIWGRTKIGRAVSRSLGCVPCTLDHGGNSWKYKNSELKHCSEAIRKLDLAWEDIFIE